MSTMRKNWPMFMIVTVGDIAFWSAHSGIVIDTFVDDPESDRPDHECISKWDNGPIIRHNLRLCPYYSGGDISFYRPAE